MYKHILVSTDGSKLSLKAIRTAASLAAKLGAKLSAVYVMPEYVPPIYGEAAMYIPEASHGRRGLAGLLLGSETTKVLTHSKVPVLVVR